MKNNVFIWLFLLAFISNVQAQQKPTHEAGSCFQLGFTHKFRSAIMSEDRVLNIYWPAEYNYDSAGKYPVIYLLDGSANEDFIHICGIAQFLAMIGAMPPTIIVGIGNVDRKRDFTFPTTVKEDKKKLPTSGGSARFMSFMEQEVQPYVKTTLRTGHSTIIGQSLGGLLATQLLLEKPGMFDTYIIVSPSLWWDNESLLSRAPALLKAHPGVKTTVYISTGGAEEDVMQKDALSLSELLKKQTGMNAIYHPEPKESHLTILHNCIYNALTALNEKK